MFVASPWLLCVHCVLIFVSHLAYDFAELVFFWFYRCAKVSTAVFGRFSVWPRFLAPAGRHPSFREPDFESGGFLCWASGLGTWRGVRFRQLRSLAAVPSCIADLGPVRQGLAKWDSVAARRQGRGSSLALNRAPSKSSGVLMLYVAFFWMPYRSVSAHLSLCSICASSFVDLVGLLVLAGSLGYVVIASRAFSRPRHACMQHSMALSFSAGLWTG